jgi:hypothetical protein
MSKVSPSLFIIILVLYWIVFTKKPRMTVWSTQGHGLSSNQPHRRIGDWAKDDGEIVFAQVIPLNDSSCLNHRLELILFSDKDTACTKFRKRSQVSLWSKENHLKAHTVWQWCIIFPTTVSVFGWETDFPTAFLLSSYCFPTASLCLSMGNRVDGNRNLNRHVSSTDLYWMQWHMLINHALPAHSSATP